MVQKTISLYKKHSVGVKYVAKARFYQVLETYNRFKQVRIARSNNQTQAVNTKIKRLKNLEEELKSVIQYDDGEQLISSLVLIGLANQNMAQSIYETPFPKGLDKKGLEEYKDGIKKLIHPYLKQAIESYNLALKKSETLQIYSEWVEYAYKGLHSIYRKDKKFQQFRKSPAKMYVFNLSEIDDMGLNSNSFFKKFKLKVKYQVSDQERKQVESAIRFKKISSLLQVVSSILNKDPDNVFALHSLSLFYLKNNKPRLATLIINRILEKTTLASFFNNLAIAFVQQGELREAISFFQKAIKKDSSHFMSRANLGTLLL